MELRLFFGIVPPRSLREEMEEWMRGAAARGVRIVSAPSIHMTLAFLGSVPVGLLRTVKAAARAAAAEVDTFTLSLGPPGGFPSPSRSRVIFLGLSRGGEEASNLASTIGRHLDEAEIPRDKKPFHPHITLARARRRPVRAPRTPGPPGTFEVESFSLISSRLLPTGARYEEIGDFQLCRRRNGRRD